MLITFKACIFHLLVFDHSMKVFQLFHFAILWMLQHKIDICTGALAPAESFMAQSFLDLVKQLSSATRAVTVPKNYTMSLSLGDPEFVHHLQAQIFYTFRKNTCA